MSPQAQRLTGTARIIVALAEFGYLTAHQITTLLYAPSSLAYVRKQLNALVTASVVLVLPRHSVTQPRVYTLSGKGRNAAAVLGIEPVKRFRPAEERDKADNLYFVQHTIAVTDVLIGARLLSQTVPGIVLHRMYTERELKRKIYVEYPETLAEDTRGNRTICLEPDASVHFCSKGNGITFFTLKSTARILQNAASSKKSQATRRMQEARFTENCFIPRRFRLR